MTTATTAVSAANVFRILRTIVDLHRNRDVAHALAVIIVTTLSSRGTCDAPYTHVQTRRRSQRVTLPQPIAASAAGERAYIVDASVNGVRLSHSSPFQEREACPISLEWHGAKIEFIAELRWTNPKAGEYQSGFEIQSIDSASSIALRGLIDSTVEGVPPYQCHELLYGVWKKRSTTDSRQPESGFTVRSTESVHTVDFMRAAYARGDRKMRERIRKLAELSITHPERHYDA
jgi:PilZ domain-containing protein